MKTAHITLFMTGILMAEPALAQESQDYLALRISALLTRQYEHKMISSGPNFPAFNVQREHRGDIIVLLHEGVPLSSIRSRFTWSDAEMERRLDELVTAGLVRQTETNNYVPTVMVMSLGDVARHVPVPESLIEEAARLIVRYLPEVRQASADIEGFSHVPFEAASLFVLSDVLLDNWQINAVEEHFLNSERPLRAGSRDYYSIQEKATWDSTEAFGIYGNQVRGYGSFTVGVYGNRRTNNPDNFLTLNRDDLELLFRVRPDSVRVFKQELLGELVEAVRGSGLAAIPSNHRAGLEALGWVQDGQIVVPVLDGQDNASLSSMARLITDDLVALFEHYRNGITQAYEGSPYAAEVTFEEYFMWWFHLFYSAVTDRLLAEGHILKPGSGITTYLLVPDSE